MLLELLRPVAATALVALSAFGAGTLLLPVFPQSLSRPARFIYSWLGGFGALGITLFVAGQWSFGRGTIAVVLAAGLALAVVRLIREPGIEWRSAIPGGTRGAMPVAMIGIVLAVAAVSGLAEPIGDVGTDGVAYHYAAPKAWLRDDIVRPLPANAPTAYPATVEMIYAALLEFGGPRAPAFSAAMTYGLFLAVCIVAARRCGLGVTSSWWAAAVIAAMPAVYRGAHSGFVDAVYAAVVLAAAHIGFEAGRRKHFIALGVFCGLAIAIKYPGLLAMPPLLLLALWPKDRRGSSGVAGNAMVACGVAAAVAAPMYLRNWILLGSPVYPPPVAAARFLQAKYMSLDSVAEFYAINARRGGQGRGLWSLITLPFNLTYHTASFNGAGGIGLVPFALVPVGLPIMWSNAFARRLALFGAVSTLTWFITMQEARFLIHVYAIAAIIGVAGWDHATRAVSARGRFMCATVVAISLAYGAGSIAKARTPDMRAALFPAYAAERRQKEIPYIVSLDALNADPSVATVLFLDPLIPAFYLDHNYIKPFGQYGEAQFGETSTPRSVLCRLGPLGVSHVLDVESAVSDFRVPANWPGLELILNAPGQRVYRVTTPSSPTPSCG